MAGVKAFAHAMGDREESGVSRMWSGRSLGSVDSITSVTRPGRGDITTMRVDR